MKALYKQQLIDHYKNPRNFGELKDPTHKGECVNETCGDEIFSYLKVNDGKIKEISFTGSGCAICIGGMSLFTEKVLGMDIKELIEMKDSDILEFLSMEGDNPRVKCATIGLHSIKDAIK